MDGRKKNKGGARPGAGRKTKAEILGLAELIDASWPIADQKKAIQMLAKDCTSIEFHVRHEARKLLLAYKFGKPKETHELTGKDAGPVEQSIVFKRANDSGDKDN